MNKEDRRMKHGKALLLALAVVTLGGCASTGAAAPEAANGVRPEETASTRTAGIHLVQAGLKEGEAAQAEYSEALQYALQAIQETPENPKAYLLAGQAAVGVNDWVQADTMFTLAEEMYPPYAGQIEAEREQGWILAYNQGAARIGENDMEGAARLFEAADRMYQGRPEARVGLGSVYGSMGEYDRAAEAYLGALEIVEAGPPEGLSEEQLTEWEGMRQTVSLNATQMLAQTGDFARAAEVLQNYLDQYGDELDDQTTLRLRTSLAGFYAQAGDAERAEAIYDDLLGREGLSADEYFQAGIGFFNTGEFDRAAEVFGQAAEMNPYSRDALLNLVQSLYSYALELEQEEETAERNATLKSLYERTVQAGEEVQVLDPLNRNLISFMLRSYRSLADLSSPAEARALNETAQTLFRNYQSQAYEVSNIQLAMESDTELGISGSLTNLSATPGSEVRLRFAILDQQGQVIDAPVITVTAPEQNSAVTFTGTARVSDDYAGWRYELVQ